MDALFTYESICSLNKRIRLSAVVRGTLCLPETGIGEWHPLALPLLLHSFSIGLMMHNILKGAEVQAMHFSSSNMNSAVQINIQRS